MDAVAGNDTQTGAPRQVKKRQSRDTLDAPGYVSMTHKHICATRMDRKLIQWRTKTKALKSSDDNLSIHMPDGARVNGKNAHILQQNCLNIVRSHPSQISSLRPPPLLPAAGTPKARC